MPRFRGQFSDMEKNDGEKLCRILIYTNLIDKCNGAVYGGSILIIQGKPWVIHDIINVRICIKFMPRDSVR